MFQPSFGQNAMAIVGLPVAVWITALGSGLAIERVARARLPNALLLPLGLAGGLVLCYPLYALGTSDVLPVALVVAVSVAGLVFARGGLRSRLNPGLPGVAGICAFVLFMLPILVTGHWLWMGYNFDNDTAVQLLLAAHLKVHGTQMLPQLSTSAAVIDTYLSTGYPLGAHVQLATLSGLLHVGPEVVYQSYMSALAAMIAIAVAAAATPAVGPRRAAVIGFAAAGANLFYQYAMQGNVKEVATAAMTVAAFALIAESLRARRRYPGAVVVAVPLAAALCTYGVAAAPYVLAAVGGSALTIVVLERRLPRRSWIGPALLGGAVVAVLAIPALENMSKLYNVAQSVVGTGGGAVVSAAVSALGQLARPLPLSQISGVWLQGDYRIPVSHHPAAGLTTLSTVVILLALIPGVLVSLRRRDAGVLVAAITTGLVLLIVIPRLTPYGAGKIYAIASPVVVWIAGIGVSAFAWRWLRPLVALASAALVVAIVTSDALAFHTDVPSPVSRMLAIRATAAHFAGRGPVLFNESDQFIKYFAGATDTIAPFDSITPQQVQLISAGAFFNYFFDLDQEKFAYVESFPVIVTRRSPIVSRPPANYKLVYSNQFYLGWERQARPQVLAHIGLQSEWSGSATPVCSAVGALARGAPRGTELLAAVVPASVGFEALTAPTRPYSWGLNYDPYDSVFTIGPGKVFETVDVPSGGLYRAWVQGSFSRPLRVYVDGRGAGEVNGVDSVDQWSAAGLARLSAGKHVLEVKRGGGTIDPGDGSYQAELGYVMLAKVGAEVLRPVPLSRWRSLCSKPADWIELIRP